MPVCVTDIERVPGDVVALYRGAESATVHEAQGRKGLMAPYMRPIYRPAAIAGTAVTCEVAPNDNWMICPDTYQRAGNRVWRSIPHEIHRLAAELDEELDNVPG